MYNFPHDFCQSRCISSSSSTPHLCLCACVPLLNHVVFLSFRIRLRRLASRKRLLKVRNNVVNVLCADRDTNEVFCDTAVRLLLVAELLMRRCPGVNG